MFAKKYVRFQSTQQTSTNIRKNLIPNIMKILSPILELLEAHTEAYFVTTEKSFLQMLVVKEPVTEQNMSATPSERGSFEKP